MVARLNCIHYRGILDQVNGSQNDIYAAANLISQADFVALQVPFTITNNVLVMNNFTSTFFQAIRQSGVPVWVYIDCFTGYPDSVSAIAGIKANMLIYYTWFQYFLELDLLAGFWLNNFGFDVTFPGPSPTNALKFVRLDQNHIIDTATQTSGLLINVVNFKVGSASEFNPQTLKFGEMAFFLPKCQVLEVLVSTDRGDYSFNWEGLAMEN